VLHLTNDRLNCSGLQLLSTFFVYCWAYYYEGRYLSLSVRRKITVNAFYSTFTNVFLFLPSFFTFFNVFKNISVNFFSSMSLVNKEPLK